MLLYFVAILLPDHLNKKITVFKHYMQQQYGCKVALRSPAHITLIPPFRLKAERLPDLNSSLKYLSDNHRVFELTLHDFAAFPPRVIYVQVNTSPELLNLKTMIEEELAAKNFPIKRDDRPFRPHVTIATRDISKANFKDAWTHFSSEQFVAAFPADHLAILVNEPHGWSVLRKFDFRKTGDG